MPDPTITDADRAAAEEYLPQVREEREVVTVSGDQYRPPDIHTSYIWVRSGINHEYHSKEEAEADRKSDVEELAAIIARHREQRERVKHCDRCGSDWADNGINSGCHCVLLSERDKAVQALVDANSCIQEELNPSNYDHETICRIARMWDEAHGIIQATLKELDHDH